MDIFELMPGFAGFQWDEGNSDKVIQRHGVSREECEETFLHGNPFVMENGEHSTGEERRLKLYGETFAGRRLSIIFTIRGDLVRVISARDMSRRERRQHRK